MKEENKLTLFIGGYLFFLFFICVLILKIGGACYTSPVEEKGYCQIQYGQDYSFNQNTNECYSYKDKQTYSFNQDDLKNVCNKPSLLSIKFFSKCFNEGRT